MSSSGKEIATAITNSKQGKFLAHCLYKSSSTVSCAWRQSLAAPAPTDAHF